MQYKHRHRTSAGRPHGLIETAALTTGRRSRAAAPTSALLSARERHPGFFLEPLDLRGPAPSGREQTRETRLPRIAGASRYTSVCFGAAAQPQSATMPADKKARTWARRRTSMAFGVQCVHRREIAGEHLSFDVADSHLALGFDDVGILSGASSSAQPKARRRQHSTEEVRVIAWMRRLEAERLEQSEALFHTEPEVTSKDVELRLLPGRRPPRTAWRGGVTSVASVDRFESGFVSGALTQSITQNTRCSGSGDRT
jgi:hypothetical protein